MVRTYRKRGGRQGPIAVSLTMECWFNVYRMKRRFICCDIEADKVRFFLNNNNNALFDKTMTGEKM